MMDNLKPEQIVMSDVPCETKLLLAYERIEALEEENNHSVLMMQNALTRVAELGVYEICCDKLTVAMAGWGWTHCTSATDFINHVQVTIDEIVRLKAEETAMQAKIDELEVELAKSKRYECSWTDCGWQKRGKEMQAKIDAYDVAFEAVEEYADSICASGLIELIETKRAELKGDSDGS